MAFSRTLQHGRKRHPATFELLESRRVLASITGTVYEDLNADDVRGLDEPRIRGAVVYLDANGNGELDQAGFGLDPDEFNEGAVLNNVRQSVSSSTAGTNNEPASRVRAAKDATRATTGDLVFSHDDGSMWTSEQRLRFDFTALADSVSLDVVGASSQISASVRLDSFDAGGLLLQTDNVNGISNSEVARLSIERAQKDIAYVVAYPANARAMVKFDNLRVNDAGDERATVTSEIGFYRFEGVPEGPVIVAQQPPENYTQTSPDGAFEIAVSSTLTSLSFGNRTASVGGIAFDDVGILGLFQSGIDQPREGTGLYLDTNLNGRADQTPVSVDPDDFLSNQVLEFVSSDVRLTVVDAANQPTAESVTAGSDGTVNLDGLIFTHDGDAAWPDTRRLRFDITTSASSVELDFIAGSADGPERGTLVAYSHNGSIIDSATSKQLEQGQRETLSILRSSVDISHVIAYTSESTTGEGRFDNFRAVTVSEPVSISNEDGDYLFKPLAVGDYRIGALPVNGQSVTFPNAAVYDIGLALGDTEDEVDFGFRLDNQPPVARGDSVGTVEDQTISIGVLVNDEDPDGIIVAGSVLITQQPEHGTAVVSANGLINYIPNDDFFGRDTLIYTVQDDQAVISNSAVVVIDIVSVNDRPEGEDDTVSILQTAPTIIDVVRNDSDIDGTLDRTSVTVLSQPSRGTVSVDDLTGNITYTTNIGGDDSFTYFVSDNEGISSEAATVTINGLFDGAAPVAVDDVATTLEGTRRDFQVLVNDSDPDGTIDADSILVVNLPSQGEVSISSGTLTYQPTLGFVGEDSFTYQVRDNDGIASNSATVAVDVTERDFPYQNPIESLDVDGNGFIIPRDVVIIINEINNRTLSDPVTGEILVAAVGRPPNYYDVNGDGFIAANDVLRVVNFLNRQGDVAAADVGENTDSAEPPVQDINVLAVAAAAAFASDFDALADEDENED